MGAEFRHAGLLLSGYPGMLPSTIKNNKSDDVFTLCFDLVLDTLNIDTLRRLGKVLTV